MVTGLRFRLMKLLLHLDKIQKQNSLFEIINELYQVLISGLREANGSHDLSQQPELEVPRHFGLEAVVDGDAPPVVQLDADRIQTQVLGERSSADADQQHVTCQSLVLPSGRRLHSATELQTASLIQKHSLRL